MADGEMEGGEEREEEKTPRSGAWIINKDNVWRKFSSSFSDQNKFVALLAGKGFV